MFGSSQGFGYGGAAAPTQEAPKRARQEDKQTCIPATVRIIQDAIARHADSQEVLIHGAEASIVQLVGVVEALVEQSAMLEFQLNDASGRIKVRSYASGSGDFSGLSNGKYVSVIGNIRTSPAAHISAMSLQPLVSADEVSYHMIEVAHAALRLRNPTKVAGVSMADPITPAKQTMGLAMGLGEMGATLSPPKAEASAPATLAPPVAPVTSVQMPLKADLRSSVIDVLRQVQDTEEGIGLSALLARLSSTDASSGKVKDILSQLVDEGDVFTTIDDDHFAMI